MLVVLVFTCGHRSNVRVPIECVAANPFYLRPGQVLPCAECGSGWDNAWHPRKKITTTLYGYDCRKCGDGQAPDVHQERPQNRPYQHHHDAPEHGPHTLAGYAIVRTSVDEDVPKVEEVDWIPGADSYPEAFAAVWEWNDRDPDAGPHVIVPVHTDGCRRDHR
ncbi:hypothetical protein BS329_38935 [Amycolatopsis coloradensis]|uniref:Uncharacterized protein n=1 Tax=Amycolatopsis coloradensis TaxID=76021 RepID=A0A1R0KES6_9PSEU|nr:hypothetical protein BS329_38935 [Amycolatopsis coloradensis]